MSVGILVQIQNLYIFVFATLSEAMKLPGVILAKDLFIICALLRTAFMYNDKLSFAKLHCYLLLSESLFLIGLFAIEHTFIKRYFMLRVYAYNNLLQKKVSLKQHQNFQRQTMEL